MGRCAERVKDGIHRVPVTLIFSRGVRPKLSKQSLIVEGAECQQEDWAVYYAAYQGRWC